MPAAGPNARRASRPDQAMRAAKAACTRSNSAVMPAPACRGAWMSPLPALWSLACGKPAFVHRAIDLGAHAAHPQVHRFGDDVAQLARGLHAVASGLHAVASGLHALASSASAASR